MPKSDTIYTSGGGKIFREIELFLHLRNFFCLCKKPAKFNFTNFFVSASKSWHSLTHLPKNSKKFLQLFMRLIIFYFKFQPDRCHHCSMCNDCVLKMDHHCPWVNNCVGFYNQKFFFLFLGYAFFYCMYIVLSTLKYFMQYWSESALNFSNGK